MISAILMVLILGGITPGLNADDSERVIGEATVAEVLAHDPEYRDRMIVYMPDSDAVADISAVSVPVTIKCFYRNDCPDSVREVPRLLKTLEVADNPEIELQIIGVSYNKREPAALLEGWNIRYVPTVVILHQGEEIGRIIEKAEASMEEDLARNLEHLNSKGSHQ